MHGQLALFYRSCIVFAESLIVSLLMWFVSILIGVRVYQLFAHVAIAFMNTCAVLDGMLLKLHLLLRV